MLSAISIVISFVIVFVLVIAKVNIGLALLVGAVVLGVFFLPVLQLFSVIGQTVIAVPTLELVLTLVSITFLNVAYHKTGTSQELGETLEKMIPSRLLVAIIPIIFGILPVSGGALFSAPLVDLEAEKLKLSRERRVFVNMWFRHIPHLLYPLETALVITSYLTGIELSVLILYQVPVFLCGMIIGYIVGIRDITDAKPVSPQRGDVQAFFLSFVPILVTVLTIIFLKIPVFLAVGLGTAVLLVLRPQKASTLVSSVKSIGPIMVVAFGIMIYRTVFEASGALDVTSEIVLSWNVWPPLLFISIPCLIGFVIGESAPSTTIALSMLSGFTFTPSAAGLAFTCMYLGHLISPLHLCFAVTAEYFQTNLSQMYKRLFPATILLLLVEILLMMLLS